MIVSQVRTMGDFYRATTNLTPILVQVVNRIRVMELVLRAGAPCIANRPVEGAAPGLR